MQHFNIIHLGMHELWQTSVWVPVAHPFVKILDVGCRSEIWAREVAEVLPHGQVLGVDLSPTFLPEDPQCPILPNLTFEVPHLARINNRWTTLTLAFNIPVLALILSQVILLCYFRALRCSEKRHCGERQHCGEGQNCGEGQHCDEGQH